MSNPPVCPMPMVWERVRAALEVARTADAPHAPKVPTPLILAGWNFSSDEEKRQRWADTVKWAERYGLTDRIPPIRDEDWYCGE